MVWGDVCGVPTRETGICSRRAFLEVGEVHFDAGGGRVRSCRVAMKQAVDGVRR